MKTFNVHDAKTQLSRLLERVRTGEEIVIAKAGEPVARLVPYAPARAPRKPGLLKGKIRIGKNFDDPLPNDLLTAFVAQSRVEDLCLLTQDQVLDGYGAMVIRGD